jgi:hypothetical protein
MVGILPHRTAKPGRTQAWRVRGRRAPVVAPEYNSCVREAWLKLVESVLLRPARPHLDRCLRERDRHRAERRLHDEERTLALARCRANIESARAAVFAADDGVVTWRMLELEREWRSLSRSDLDDGWMDLWARVAPASWIDRKRWRDSDAAARLDAAITLAADVEGVEAAESAVDSLVAALAAWGTPIGTRIRWRPFERDAAHAEPWLAEPLRASREALSARGLVVSAVVARERRLEQVVLEAARARFPERPLLARDLAHAAFVDGVWRAASLDGRPNPVTPMYEIWKAGYAFSAIDASGVTLEITAL